MSASATHHAPATLRAIFAAGLLLATIGPAAPAAPVTTHPRLWIRDADLPRLRSWATASNPLYQDGLSELARHCREDMDAGYVPAQDDGSYWFQTYPTEAYAMVFAFMSLVETDPAVVADYQRRAHDLIMHVFNQAVLGPADGVPFRDPRFNINVRGFGYGEAFPLVVDWCYGTFTAAEKATIRTVFLRWIEENKHAETTTNNHPVPVGVENDPVLLQDPELVRWSTNNFYLSHMRNIGMMSMALDAGDDPGGLLAAQLGNATGAWLYVFDDMLKHHSQGGLPAEGFMYGGSALAYAAELHLAMRTAGQDDPAVWGPQVQFSGHPFWEKVVPAYLHSLSPKPVVYETWQGPVYQPAWYGDGDRYWFLFHNALFASIGMHDMTTGNQARLDACRWFVIEGDAGGYGSLIVRMAHSMSHSGSGRDALMMFMLLDPADLSPADPRPNLPLHHEAPGIGRILSRTSWDGDEASWFTYKLSWNDIDHQHGDGNMFELYRKGEWLTKERTGYGYTIACSDYHNTFGLENDYPDYAPQPGDYGYESWARGGQWGYSGGDPTLVARSITSEYTYALGDATNLYNSTNHSSTDIREATRSIIWLAPDHIVVYDRAESGKPNRFKRFWLSIPANATVANDRATMTLPSGQSLVVTKLLPAAATLTVEPAEQLPSEPAEHDTMDWRLRTEDPSNPLRVRFLHVLQGTDAGASADLAANLQSTSGKPHEGAAVGSRAVLFPVDVAPPFTGVTYGAPLSATRHYVTGLTPLAAYDVLTTVTGGTMQVSVAPNGTTLLADDGGVLVFDPLACGAMTLDPATLPLGRVGQAYAATFTAAGAPGPFTFGVTSGSLPAGLALSPAGTLSGTPTAPGLATFDVTATGGTGCTVTGSYVLLVNAASCGAISIAPPTLPAGDIGTAYAAQLSASGGAAPYAFGVVLGSLPPGLSLSGSGLISGTPTANGSRSFTVLATDAQGCGGLADYTIVIGRAVDHVAGAGLGQPNPNRVRLFTSDGTATSVDFLAYGTGSWGVNTSAPDLDGGGLAEVVTGPGPGAVFGPQARGFQRDGTPMGKVNFYAYGTLRYGLNVAAAGTDADGYGEIVTGAGPGTVFGPHVRGFDVDAGAAKPIARINLFAYSTLRYGVNVAGGDVEGDGYQEILTGPGPGLIFGSQVRGFDVDGGNAASISKINFNAFPATGFGANVASGDVDGDAIQEILAVQGPSPIFVTEHRGYDYDGAAVAALPGFVVTSFATHYGGRVGAGDVDPAGGDELLAGAGRDPAADSTVKRYGYDGATLSLVPGSFQPFPGLAYGVNVAAGPLGY